MKVGVRLHTVTFKFPNLPLFVSKSSLLKSLLANMSKVWHFHYWILHVLWWFPFLTQFAVVKLIRSSVRSFQALLLFWNKEQEEFIGRIPLLNHQVSVNWAIYLWVAIGWWEGAEAASRCSGHNLWLVKNLHVILLLVSQNKGHQWFFFGHGMTPELAQNWHPICMAYSFRNV